MRGNRSEALINIAHHTASAMEVVLPIQNSASSGTITAACGFRATVRDYTNKVLGTVHRDGYTVQVSHGTEVECRFTVNRTHYRNYTRTAIDVASGQWGEGMLNMDPSERAYKLVIEATVAAGGQLVYSSEREKVICSPLKGPFRSGKIICDDNRGFYVRPSYYGNIFDHLTSANCGGITSNWAGTLNSISPRNGKCDDPSAGTELNVNPCWDGGDCCSLSCYHFNGYLITNDNDGNIIPAHECWKIDDK